MNILTIYNVKIRKSALQDLVELRDWLCTVMSREGAHCYITNMQNEVQSLSIYADLYHPSTMADIRQYHPKARRMVSHNKRWVYIFHIENNTVIVDRVRPSKMITK